MSEPIASAFVTGNSSGIGLGLTRALQDGGTRVFGLSRRGCPLRGPLIVDQRCDLADLDRIPAALDALLGELGQLDLAVLNAGLLGEIRDLADTPLADIRRVMDVNVWANKLIIDWLIHHPLAPRQLVLISSGAAVNGHRGWGAYSLSKATLNMLTRLYAPEMPESHLCALAPGLVDTGMQDYLCDPRQVDADRFASVTRLRAARGTEAMPGPEAAAQRLLAVLPTLRAHPSGSFLDLRELGSAD